MSVITNIRYGFIDIIGDFTDSIRAISLAIILSGS